SNFANRLFGRIPNPLNNKPLTIIKRRRKLSRYPIVFNPSAFRLTSHVSSFLESGILAYCTIFGKERLEFILTVLVRIGLGFLGFELFEELQGPLKFGGCGDLRALFVGLGGLEGFERADSLHVRVTRLDVLRQVFLDQRSSARTYSVVRYGRIDY